jgi:mannose-6-phosphate isomerase-like protein (cupin superfamily)
MGNIVSKPWGSYEDIFRSDGVVFKTITVSPGEEISYQQHHKRSEFWYVLKGVGIFKYNGTNWKVKPGFNIHVRINDAHQIINTGETDMVIYEMQFGFCTEEDIVRLEDKYNRG